MTSRQREIDRPEIAAALAKTHSAFFVPLIVSALYVSYTPEDLEEPLLALTREIVPRIADGARWAGWSQQLAVAMGWIGDRRAAAKFRAENVCRRGGLPYVVAKTQDVAIERLFRANAEVAREVTEAAVKYATIPINKNPI